MSLKNRNLSEAGLAALHGLRFLTREKSFLRELSLVFLAFIALAIRVNLFSITLLIISFIILSFEAINTAIERLCDFIHPGIDQNIKAIKDVSASAIFILLIFFFCVFVLWAFSIF